MLPYDNRITRKEDYASILKDGASFSFGALVVKVRKNGLSLNRAGIIVSGKFSSRAVLRNRIKRQLRAILKKKLDGLKKGRDLVIIARRQDGKVVFSAKELEKWLDAVIAKAELI